MRIRDTCSDGHIVASNRDSNYYISERREYYEMLIQFRYYISML